MRDMVIYESRLELACLLFGDFDASVRHIVAQPFLLKAEVPGDERVLQSLGADIDNCARASG